MHVHKLRSIVDTDTVPLGKRDAAADQFAGRLNVFIRFIRSGKVPVRLVLLSNCLVVFIFILVVSLLIFLLALAMTTFFALFTVTVTRA